MTAFRPFRLVLTIVGIFSCNWVTGILPGQSPALDSGAPAFFFHDGDTPVVFLGDGAVEQRMYTKLIETYVLSRYPAMKITFRNAGWDGDTSWLSQRGDFDAALQRDVLSLEPKVILINFGMNDARGGDGTYSKYLESSTKLAKALKPSARIALITASPEERYESDSPAGSHYNLALKKYADGLKEVSDNERVLFVDLFSPMVKLIEAGRQAAVLSTTSAPDSARARLTLDGVRPNWGGHLIMASLILDQMNATDLVSSMTLDAGAHSITASQGCLVEYPDSKNGVVQLKRTDSCLPWPLPADPSIDDALKIPGFDPATDLDRYELKVTGLTAASYVLSIDGDEIGTYAGADLAKGINLALVRKGPIYAQEQQLLQAVTTKNDAYFNRWRQVQLFQMPDWLTKYPEVESARKAEIARLDKVIADTEQNIEILRKPVQHVFRLDPVK